MSKCVCAYCGLDDSACLVFCTTTKKWFCNGTSGDTSYTDSHIVIHLDISHSKTIQLNPDGHSRNDPVLKCDVCGSSNVFQLGLLPIRGSSSMVRVICRTNCMNSTDGAAEDAKLWKAVIQGGRIDSSLVKIPTDEAQLATQLVSMEMIRRLEAAWKNDPNITLDNLPEASRPDYIAPIGTRFTNSVDYKRAFSTLVHLEALSSKHAQESFILNNVELRWETREDRIVAYLCLGSSSEVREVNVICGTEMKIRLADDPSDSWSATGQVIRFSNESINEVLLDITGINRIPDRTARFQIQIFANLVPFHRMQEAISSLAERHQDRLPSSLKDRLYGKEAHPVNLQCTVPLNCSAPGLPKLNRSQQEAVKTVLPQPISLIQGPPGTGKTVTAASTVYHLFRLYKQKILAVAPSNSAVDELCERISKTGLKVIRVVAKSREDTDSPVRHLMSHVRAIRETTDSELLALHKRREQICVLSRADERRYRELREVVEQKLISEADVVCATCVTAGCGRVASYVFHTVLVDECAQATEPECLIPILSACHQVIMVGDHCQLGPVLKCAKANRAGLGRSFFERLVLLNMQPSMLKVQYRMHPTLSKYPSAAFYQGQLVDGVKQKDRTDDRLKSFWVDPKRPTLFYCVESEEERASNGVSFLNRTEARAVEEFLTKLLKRDILPENIGVITPYNGQRAYLLHYLRIYGSLQKQKYDNVEIASVNEFQGREKDYIIVSCVRANCNKKVGFLSDPRRLNVALTRARFGLIIIGNVKALCGDPVWNDLIHYYHEEHLLVHGSIDNLQEYTPMSSKPKEKYEFKLAAK